MLRAGGLAAVVEWLPEGQRRGGAEQLEGAGLDGGGGGELLDALPGEADGLAVEGRQVAEQVAVASRRSATRPPPTAGLADHHLPCPVAPRPVTGR